MGMAWMIGIFQSNETMRGGMGPGQDRRHIDVYTYS